LAILKNDSIGIMEEYYMHQQICKLIGPHIAMLGLLGSY